jgi:CelD/BcsL family acetyltransferase involved in cellulose biosynthesis/glycosyltransferase involved in cell wall biosynthesis
MPLTVLSVGYPLAKVSDHTAGGAEQVLSILDRGLVRAGHRSMVLAPAGSRCRGLLISVPVPSGLLDDAAKQEARRKFRNCLNQALDRYSVDIVHMHGLDFSEYLPDSDIPVVVTLHLPLSWYVSDALRDSGSNTVRVCVSRSQAHRAPLGTRIDSVIPNGIDLTRFRPARKRGNYAVMIGRICPEKGFDLAIGAAQRAGIDVIIAGTVFEYPEHREYFDSKIAPRLSHRVRYIGAVGGEPKARLLAGAKCLLIPSLVQETSSLVAMEAMASGTPVIARRSGALPEIIQQGYTGFLVDSVEEMAHAITVSESLRPEVCRREAERRFSSEKMIAQYFKLYRSVMAPTEVRASDVSPGLQTGACGVHAALQAGPGGAQLRNDFAARLVTTPEQFRSVAPEWRDLWQRCPEATTFQRPEWLLPWIEAFSPREPAAIEVRHQGLLVGFAPLLIYSRGMERVLAFIGGGVSDYLNVLLDPRYTRETMASIFAAIQKISGWDLLELTDLSSNSVLLRDAVTQHSISKHDVCSVLNLPESTQELMHIFSKRQRANLRNARSRMQKAGGAQIEIASSETLPSFIEDLFRLHTARWSRTGQPGVLHEEAVKGFHIAAAPALFDCGALSLYRLRLGQQTLAVIYALFDRERVLCYLQGFDPESVYFSPGTVLMFAVIEDAIKRGIRKFDFLRGQESYKQHWRAQGELTYRIRLGRAALGSALERELPWSTAA